MEKDYVNYIMNGDPGLPDEELPELEDLPAQEHGLDQLHKEDTQTVRMRKLYNQGLDDKTIAAQLGLPHSNTVMWWRRKAKLPPNKTKLPAKRTHKAPSGPESVAAGQPETIEKQELVAEMKADIYEAKETCRKIQESIPDSQITSLAAITLKILLQIWRRLGEEESI